MEVLKQLLEVTKPFMKPETIMLFSVLLVIALFIWYKRYPPMEDLASLSNVVNSRGGNILVLVVLSLLFFQIGMKFMYYLIDLMVNNKLGPDNAMAMLGVQFCTGTAFGAAFGALLKTMTGEEVKQPNITTTVETKVSSGKSPEVRPEEVKPVDVPPQG